MPSTADPTLRIAIVDDELLARAVVREHLAQIPGVEIVAECANGFEAVKAVAELAPDLLLLDVQMPKLNGFEVLELVGRDVAVIFTTAHDEYAIRAFEVHAVDYLLKPFGADRLAEAVARARERLQRREPAAARAIAASAAPPTGPPPRVLVRDGGRVHVIPVAQIDFIQAQDDYVAYAAGGRQYLKEQTLADVEETLGASRFVRVHRSYIINLDRLSGVELDARENRVAVLTTGDRIPVSRSGHARLTERLGTA
ncbi:MAG: LytR/AlgR family response regulator transcription factor [Vicinamibacterales bacterium]